MTPGALFKRQSLIYDLIQTLSSCSVRAFPISEFTASGVNLFKKGLYFMLKIFGNTALDKIKRYLRFYFEAFMFGNYEGHECDST